MPTPPPILASNLVMQVSSGPQGPWRGVEYPGGHPVVGMELFQTAF